MAEDLPTPKHEQDDLDNFVSHDDVNALGYVLHHVKGASPSSFSPLVVDEIEA